jgi:hypothetical protein
MITSSKRTPSLVALKPHRHNTDRDPALSFTTDFLDGFSIFMKPSSINETRVAGIDAELLDSG